MTREEQNQAILEMWGEGKSASQIAKAVGLTRSNVLGRVRRLDIHKKDQDQ